MIQPDRPQVRRLRSLVRARVKATPALRAEKKRLRRARRLTPFAARLLMSMGVAVFLLAALGNHVPVARIQEIFLLWILALTGIRAQQIAAACSDPNHLGVPYLLPLSDDEVFLAQRRFVWRTTWWSAVEGLVYASLVTAFAGHGPIAWLAVPLLAAAYWLGTLALAAGLVWLRPGLQFRFMTSGAILLGILTLWTFRFPNFYSNYLAPVYAAVRTITPHGWMVTAFSSALEPAGWTGILVLAVMVAGAWFSLPRLVTALRAQFQPERLFGYEDEPADQVAWEPAEAERAEELAREAATTPLPPREPESPVDRGAVAAALRSEQERPAGLELFDRGLIERWIARLLSPRLCVVVDYMKPAGWPPARRFLAGLGVVILSRLLQGALPTDADVGAVGTVTVILVILFTMPVLGGAWQGFALVNMENAQAPLYAFTPLSLGEMVRALLAVNLLRIVVMMPLLFLALWLCCTPAPMPLLSALDYTWRIAGLVVALQPLATTLKFSRHNSGRSLQWWLMTAAFVALALVAVTGFMFSIAGLAMRTTGLTLLSLGGFLTATTLILLLYVWSWNRSWFDVTPRKPA
jgi:hypothetical protein